jgi:uncharacterized membrane protein
MEHAAMGPGATDSARWRPLLLAAAAVAALAALSLVPVLGVPAGLCLCLGAPGVAFRRTLMRSAGEERADVGAAIHAVVLSAAMTALLVVLMAAAGIKVTRASVVLGLAVLTILVLVLGAGVHRGELRLGRGPWRPSPSMVPAAIVVALAVGVAALAAAAMSTPAPAPYSALYLLGSSGTIDQPAYVAPGQPVGLTVGLDNHTSTGHIYTVKAELEGRVLSSVQEWVGPWGTARGALGGRIRTGGCLERLTVTASAPGAGAARTVGVWLRWSRGSTCRG